MDQQLLTVTHQGHLGTLRAVLLHPARGLGAPGAAGTAPPRAAPRRHTGTRELSWPATWGRLCRPPKYTAGHLGALRKRGNRRFATPGTTNTARLPFHTRAYVHKRTRIYTCTRIFHQDDPARLPVPRLPGAAPPCDPQPSPGWRPQTALPAPAARPHGPPAHLRSARPGSARLSSALPGPALPFSPLAPEPPVPTPGRRKGGALHPDLPQQLPLGRCLRPSGALLQ